MPTSPRLTSRRRLHSDLLAIRPRPPWSGALAAARQAGPDSATIIDAARNAFTDGLGPAMFVAAALCIAAAAFTTFIGIRNRPAAVTQPTASAP